MAWIGRGSSKSVFRYLHQKGDRSARRKPQRAGEERHVCNAPFMSQLSKHCDVLASECYIVPAREGQQILNTFLHAMWLAACAVQQDHPELPEGISQKSGRHEGAACAVELKSARNTNDALRRQVKRLKSPGRTLLPGVVIGLVLGALGNAFFRRLRQKKAKEGEGSNDQEQAAVAPASQ
eukprot:1156280-Pelagomonas_calceolata.AAC.8